MHHTGRCDSRVGVCRLAGSNGHEQSPWPYEKPPSARRPNPARAQVFKPHLEPFLEPLFRSLGCGHQLCRDAAGACLGALRDWLGPRILAGRLSDAQAAAMAASPDVPPPTGMLTLWVAWVCLCTNQGRAATGCIFVAKRVCRAEACVSSPGHMTAPGCTRTANTHYCGSPYCGGVCRQEVADKHECSFPLSANCCIS